MIRRLDVKNLMESRGPRGFVIDIWHALGLTDNRGVQHINPRTGQPILNVSEATMAPEEFSLRALFEGICGEQGLEALEPGNMSRFARLQEAGPGAVGVTAFAN